MSFVLPQGLQTQRPTEARLGCQQQGLIESFWVPMLQWQKYRTSLEKWLSSSYLPPPSQLLVVNNMKERSISVGCLQFTKKDTLIVPHIRKFRKLTNSSPTHNNSTAEGYSKLLQYPKEYHWDGSPDGQLHISLHRSRCDTLLTHTLPKNLQKEMSKSVPANEQFYSVFFSLRNCYTTSKFQKV